MWERVMAQGSQQVIDVRQLETRSVNQDNIFGSLLTVLSEILVTVIEINRKIEKIE
jgi:hypothetical protein